MNFRIGFGYDVHRFAADRKLWLGGVEIDYPLGLIGHSDADVLIHALCDAILGATNLRDIGFHFPDNADEYKDIDSKILLQNVMKLIRSKGYEFGNCDCTIATEQPKLNPHIPRMQQKLSEVMSVDIDSISIKATTNETMGFVGRKEGIATYVTVLLYKKAL